MEEKLRATAANTTSDFGLHPRGITSIGCKWVYFVKIKSNGHLDKYKTPSGHIGKPLRV